MIISSTLVSTSVIASKHAVVPHWAGAHASSQLPVQNPASLESTSQLPIPEVHSCKQAQADSFVAKSERAPVHVVASVAAVKVDVKVTNITIDLILWREVSCNVRNAPGALSGSVETSRSPGPAVREP